ncbi:calphotin-like [Macrobrachium rosenbergii]|uniref:calphotin-like n=1 Tax=Macrobrachium rosenbergii TaxID=79674 RepID=UPI0034D79953
MDDSSCPAIETLPVPIAHTDQRSAPSVTDVELFPTSTPVPESAFVSVPEQALELLSGGPITCKPLTPITNSSSSPKSSEDKNLLAEIDGTTLTPVVTAAEVGGTPSDPVVGTTTVKIVAAAKAVAGIVSAPPIEAACNGTPSLGPEVTPVPPQEPTAPIRRGEPSINPVFIPTVDPEEKLTEMKHTVLLRKCHRLISATTPNASQEEQLEGYMHQRCPGPASVPAPGPQSDLPPGDAKFLPVPLACTEQCQAPSVLTDEHKKPLIVPDSDLVPAPEHNPDLHSRDPTQDPLSSPGLAPLPASVREIVPLNHSGSSPKGVALQPVPELVIDTCEPLTPPPTASSLPQSIANAIASQDSAISHLADELQELRQIMDQGRGNRIADHLANDTSRAPRGQSPYKGRQPVAVS